MLVAAKAIIDELLALRSKGNTTISCILYIIPTSVYILAVSTYKFKTSADFAAQTSDRWSVQKILRITYIIISAQCRLCYVYDWAVAGQCNLDMETVGTGVGQV